MLESLFFKKSYSLAEACYFIKKDTLAQEFSYEFCEIFKNIFFTEQFRLTASENLNNIIFKV